MSALANVPRLLRAVLQALRVGDLCEEELPQLGQILSMMLQHAPLRSHLLANTALLQLIIQELTVSRETCRHTAAAADLCFLCSPPGLSLPFCIGIIF